MENKITFSSDTMTGRHRITIYSRLHFEWNSEFIVLI